MIKHRKSQIEFNKLRKKIFDDNSNKDNITKNKNTNNNSISIEEKYKTFNNISKIKNQNEFNNNKIKEHNYFSYLKNKEIFYNNNNIKKNEENKNTNISIDNKKDKLLKYLVNNDNNDNNNKKEKAKNNINKNLINNYISESKHFGNNKNQNNINDIISIINKYKTNKKKVNNKSNYNLKIINFNFSFIKNELNNEENRKLIKIYEKKIQQLEQKLIEANEKINNLNDTIVNNKFEIIKLKEELNKKNNNNNINIKLSNSCTNFRNINNDSLIIKLPQNFKSKKISKESDITDNNIHKDNSDYTFGCNNNQNNSMINECKIYKKKIYTKIYKKSNINKRTLSQPNQRIKGSIEKINIILDKLKSREKYTNITQKNSFDYNNKIKNNEQKIYTIYPLSNNQKILSFDLNTKNFLSKTINPISSNDFTKNYIESFRLEQSEYNSIHLYKNNILYIITGKNSDIFYKYNTINNTLDIICTLKNNHANGVLISHENNIFCLSGKYNKKVELYSEEKKSWEEISEMNIERSYFNACIIHDKFLFCLFGYNTPSNKYLDTIEFCDISNLSLYSNSNKWQYLNCMNNNSINMNICGFACINYLDEKIIIFGGINGIEKKPLDKIYQIYLDKNFFEGYENNYLEEIKEINDIYQNKCYYFKSGFDIFEDNNNINNEDKKYFYAGFDNNYNVHIIKINGTISHDIHFFHN